MPKKQSINARIASLGSLADQMSNPLTAIYVRLSGLKQPRHKQSQIDMLTAIENDLRRLEHVVKDFISDVGKILESDGGKRSRKK